MPHGTKQKRIMKKLKIKAEMLRRNGPVIKPWISPEAERESMVGKICEKGRYFMYLLT